MSTTLDSQRDGPVLAERPQPGSPRRYDFPNVTTHTLANGLSIAVVDLPGRPLVSASLIVSHGASDEPPEMAGATVLAGRALTEGTARRDAIELVEAGESGRASPTPRRAGCAVGRRRPGRAAPGRRWSSAEVFRTSFPRVGGRRLRDGGQRSSAGAGRPVDASKRHSSTPSTRTDAVSPPGGLRDTVGEPDAADLRATYERPQPPTHPRRWGPRRLRCRPCRRGGLMDVVGTGRAAAVDDAGATGGRIVRVIHRPGAVQTEIRSAIAACRS